MKDFRTLKVWERGHALVLSVYKLTSTFPKEERYGLTSQLRRATSSIPMNIAEGCGRPGDGDFYRFLSIAMGSAVEAEYLLLLSFDLKLISNDSYTSVNESILEVQRMLGALIRKVQTARTRD